MAQFFGGRSLGVLVLVATVAFSVMLLRLFPDVNNDYAPHVGFAMRLGQDGVIERPNLLFHLFIVALVPLFDYINAGLVVSVLFYLLGIVVVYLIVRPAFNSGSRRSAVYAWLLSIALLLVTPITLFTFSQANLYLGYIGINVYHNPTSIVLKPFALLTCAFTLAALSGQIHFSIRIWIVALILVTLCVFAKPSYLMSLMPALTIVLVYSYVRGKRANWRLPILGIIVPTMILLALQYGIMFYHADISAQNSIIFAPLVVMRLNDPMIIRLGIKFLLSIAFPMAVYLLYFRNASRDLSLNLCWLTFFFGAAQVYLLAEAGPHIGYGNFLWTGQITLFVLFVYSAIFLVKQVYMPAGRGIRALISISLFVLHLMSGLLFYWVTLTFPDFWHWM